VGSTLQLLAPGLIRWNTTTLQLGDGGPPPHHRRHIMGDAVVILCGDSLEAHPANRLLRILSCFGATRAWDPTGGAKAAATRWRLTAGIDGHVGKWFVVLLHSSPLSLACLVRLPIGLLLSAPAPWPNGPPCANS